MNDQPSRRSDDPTRRGVLHRTAGLAATGALAGLAGCSRFGGSDTDTDGGDGETATTTATGTAAGTTFAYDHWLPAPSTIGRDRYAFGLLESASLSRYADVLDEDYRERLAGGGFLSAVTGVDPLSADVFLASAAALTLSGSFDRAAVTSSLRDSGFEQAGSHGGFALWTGSDGSEYAGRTVAVGDGLLLGSRGTDPEPVKAAIDAGNGEGDRFASAGPGAAALVSELRSGQIRVGLQREPPEETDVNYGQFAGNTGLGWRLSVGIPRSTVDIVFVFESADQADADAVRSWWENARSGALSTLQDVSVTADGNVVTMSGSMATEDLKDSPFDDFFVSIRGGGRGTDADVPSAGVGWEVDSAAHRVSVTLHSKGSDTDYVSVTFDPADGSAVEKRIDEVGGQVSYEDEAGTEVELTATAHAGDRSVVVMTTTVGL